MFFLVYKEKYIGKVMRYIKKKKRKKQTRTNVSMSHTTVLSSLPKIRESFEENIMCIKRLYAVYDEKNWVPYIDH